MKFDKVYVSKSAFESEDNYAIIQGVIDFVNHCRSKDISPDNLNPDAVNSYFVDYYSVEFCNGAFSQFIYNSGGSDFILDCVADGLKKMGAVKNLEFFNKCRALLADLSDVEFQAFQQSEYFGENATREKLDPYKWEFFDIKREESIEDLHSTWLKNNECVVALESDALTQEMNKIK